MSWRGLSRIFEGKEMRGGGGKERFCCSNVLKTNLKKKERDLCCDRA